MSGKIATVIVGFGLEVVYLAAPTAFPDIPHTIWLGAFFLGIALIVIPGGLWLFSYYVSKKTAIQDDETIPAFEAMRLLAKARPNSYETTAITLADWTRLGKIQAFGRVITKMAIPDHITVLDQIPPDIWSYSMIDATLIHGPLPVSKMKYRQLYSKSRIKDDRTLYDAVRFNKKEFLALCRAVNT